MKKLHRCAMNGIDELSDDVSEYRRSYSELFASLIVNSAERREESREYSLGLRRHHLLDSSMHSDDRPYLYDRPYLSNRYL